MILHVHEGRLWAPCSHWGLIDTGEEAPGLGPELSPGFDRVECPVCEFDAIIPAGRETDPCCPLCADDCGRDQPMTLRRPARLTDKPEGRDARRLGVTLSPYVRRWWNCIEYGEPSWPSHAWSLNEKSP